MYQLVSADTVEVEQIEKNAVKQQMTELMMENEVYFEDVIDEKLTKIDVKHMTFKIHSKQLLDEILRKARHDTKQFTQSIQEALILRSESGEDDGLSVVKILDKFFLVLEF